jgi:hypothetical protein
MRVLLLGTSNDRGGWGAEKRPGDVLQEELERLTGEPSVVVSYVPWPSPNMHLRIERLVQKERPEVVYYVVHDHPYAFISTPMRVRRLLRLRSDFIVRAAHKAARNPATARSPLLRAVRRLATAVIGGDTYMTPQEALEHISATIRRLASHQETTTIVKGPQGWVRYGVTPRQRRTAEEKRLFVHRALEDLCAGLPVHYLGSERSVWDQPGARVRVGVHNTGVDGMHFNDAGVLESAQEICDDILPILRDTKRYRTSSSA